jgi:hypothetical protein
LNIAGGTSGFKIIIYAECDSQLQQLPYAQAHLTFIFLTKRSAQNIGFTKMCNFCEVIF